MLINSAIEHRLRDKIVSLARCEVANKILDRSFNASYTRRLKSWKGVRLISEIVKQPGIRSVLEDTFDTPVVEHFFFLIKDPAAIATQKHQDCSYWNSHQKTLHMQTLWISLNGTSKENGAMRFHGDPNKQLDHIGTEINGTTIPSLEHLQLDEKTINMSPCDAVFFFFLEIHSSHPNDSQEPRLAMKIVLGEMQHMYHYLFPAFRPDIAKYCSMRATQIHNKVRRVM